jgi:hypothetical protein
MDRDVVVFTAMLGAKCDLERPAVNYCLAEFASPIDHAATWWRVAGRAHMALGQDEGSAREHAGGVNVPKAHTRTKREHTT